MTSKHRITIVGASLLAGLGAGVLAGPSLAAHSQTHVIKAQNIRFSPEHLVIHRGDRVTWRFLDAPVRAAHTVTSEGSRHFKDSPQERLTGSFTATFASRGTYRFQCTNHPLSMNGVIIVR